VTNPLSIYEHSGKGYVSSWYGCPADSYEIVVVEPCFVIHKDEGDVARCVVAVADVAVTLIDLDGERWYDSFHLGFLASRVDIAWMSLGRHRYTSCPAMVNASDHTICMGDSLALSFPLSSAKMTPRFSWHKTKSGKPACPCNGVFQTPGRISTARVCITSQPCNLASMMT